MSTWMTESTAAMADAPQMTVPTPTRSVRSARSSSARLTGRASRSATARGRLPPVGMVPDPGGRSTRAERVVADGQHQPDRRPGGSQGGGAGFHRGDQGPRSIPLPGLLPGPAGRGGGTDHPWVLRRTPVTAAVLARTPLVVWEPGSGTREVVTETLAANGLGLLTSMELGSTAAIQAAAARGWARRSYPSWRWKPSCEADGWYRCRAPACSWSARSGPSGQWGRRRAAGGGCSIWRPPSDSRGRPGTAAVVGQPEVGSGRARRGGRLRITGPEPAPGPPLGRQDGQALQAPRRVRLRRIGGQVRVHHLCGHAHMVEPGQWPSSCRAVDTQSDSDRVAVVDGSMRALL